MTRNWRDPLTALSLANLLLLPVWQVLLIGHRHPYMDKHAPARPYFVAAVAVMLVLAAGLWLAWRLAGRFGRRGMVLARTAFVVSLIGPLHFLNQQTIGLQGAKMQHLLPGGLFWTLAVTAGVALIVIASRSLVAAWARKAVLLLLPLVPMTTGQALWHAARYSPLVGQLPQPAPVLTHQQAPFRMVWIIFDEFDQRLAFDQRPAGLALPELDRWRQREFMATNAYPPAAMTLLAMPALFTGLPVTAAVPANAADLALTVAGRPDTSLWSQQKSVFRRLRAAGGDSALVGWYHPYGRVLGADLTTCFWESNEAETLFAQSPSPGATVANIGTWVSLHWPFVSRLPHNNSNRYRQVWVEYFQSLREESRRQLASPTWELLVLHWPIPHPKGLYNRHTGQLMQMADSYPSSYLDNLVLLDRSLAEMRRQLETQGDWDRTAVLVSSDHWWRHRLHKGILTPEEQPLATGTDHRIPFLLHLPGSPPTQYRTPFNTLLSGDLLMAVWQGQVRHSKDMVPWLDRHRQTRAEFPGTQKAWPYQGQPDDLADHDHPDLSDN
jgi:uncharacterized protein YhhL (DUF1145 family)